MKLIRTRNYRGQFDPVVATAHAQVAMMTLQPGGTSDEELSNEHPDSEQWLFVLSGEGIATTAPRRGRRRSGRIRSGVLVVIERGELHQIKCVGSKPLRTLNFYVPPAYRADGTLRKRTRNLTR